MPSVLIVCTANLCRSPMAMALLKHLLHQHKMYGWRVESAGTWVQGISPAVQTVQDVLADFGLNIQDHRSRVVTRELLRQFDLILTMETGQKEALTVEFPEIAPRLFLLSEMVGEEYSIPDPIGGELSDYRRTAARIHRLLTQGFERIVRLAENPEPLDLFPAG
ncbi:MAG: hypothetical protein AB1345_03800 [Chloroflexota bacterium]